MSEAENKDFEDELAVALSPAEEAQKDGKYTELYDLIYGGFSERLEKFSLNKMPGQEVWVCIASAEGYKEWHGVGGSPIIAIRDAKSKDK